MLEQAKQYKDKPAIIVEMFDGSDAREKVCLLDDLNYSIIRDYTSSNNREPRLALLRIKEEYEEN